MSKGKFYITTPIYYPSDKLHIGHTYCTVATDAIARYKRMCGYDVMFLTGTDEHGQKIEEKAKAAGVTPKQFVDNIVEGPGGVRDAVEADEHLQRPLHPHDGRLSRRRPIQRIFKKMYDKGDIYKGKYTGMYCTPCESFWTESQLVDGKCPDCGREVHYAEEEAYFFRLSKYAEPRARAAATAARSWSLPARVNEMINNFIDPGLEDLCVSRTSFTWGIPVDFDPGHVVYVWVDALFNYMHGARLPERQVRRLRQVLARRRAHGRQGDRALPLHHLAGHAHEHGHAPAEEGLRPRLAAARRRQDVASRRATSSTPYVLAERYGVDALRYFLLRDVPARLATATSPTSCSSPASTPTSPTTSATSLSRTVAMVIKYFGGTLPAEREHDALDDELIAMASALRETYAGYMDNFGTQQALIEVFKVISRANKYIDETAPWVLAKDESKRARLATVLYNLLETLRITVTLLLPFMPDSCEKAFAQIGAAAEQTTWDNAAVWGVLPADVTVHKGETLFPRIDMAKELAELEALKAAKEAAAAPKSAPVLPDVTIDDFSKCDMRVCKVTQVRAGEKVR